MSNVGYATLQVIPSVRGIGAELQRQLVGPAADAGSDAGEEAGGGFREAFTGVLAALGVEALAEKAGEVFSEAFNQALEQSNVTSTLQAQLGASGADATKYGKVVGSLYAKGVTENFEQGAEAIRSVVSGGLVDPTATNAQLESIATKMTDVSNVFGTDLGLQTQAISALLKNQLAPNASEALDVITYGLQKLGPNAEDLLETFQEYPVQLKKLGLDATTSLGLFRQGLQGGARDTDIIADALKEFSIRAIDGSTTTAAGYKLLGLNVKKTSELVAKGGDSASSALDIVLDRLRAIPDPVKRAAAATDLFGTQSEDLGAALFKLDPSAAVDGLGNFTGAADQLGKTLRSGPSYEIELFKRTVQQGLVTFIGGQVLPILSKWGQVFDQDVLPPLSAVGGVLASLFLPTLAVLLTVGRGTVDWVREWGIWLVPIAILIGGITLALSAQAIATSFVTGVFTIYRTAILIGTAVTEGFTGAQAALNAVMDLNPVTLIVIAVLALAAAVFIAWKRSDTFRGIVMAAWHGIQTAALTAWTTVLKPTIDGLVKGWQAVAAGALWLFNTVLAPAFNFILPYAQILATIIGVVLVVAFKVWWFGTKLYIDAIVLLFKGVAAVVTWLYSTVVAPIVGLIVFNFKLWWLGGKLYVEANIALLRLIGSVAVWLWKNVISPVVGWIVGGFKLWWVGVKLYVGFVVTLLHGLGSTATWLYRSAVSPALHSIATVAQWLYDKGLKPPIDKAKALASAFGSAFKSAAGVIRDEFHKIEGYAKTPIAFVINTVYNRGLVGVWNKVAGAFGAPKLGMFKGFATGGPVFGAGTETSDDVPAWLSRNEHVWTAQEVKGAGGHGAVAQLRAWAAAGGGGAAPGFKGGGAFGWIGSAANAVAGAGSSAWNSVKKGASWLKDTLAGSARAGVRAVVDPLLNRIPGLDTGWGSMVRHIPEQMINALFGFADRSDKKGASAVGGDSAAHGASASAAQAIARGMLGRYGWDNGQMSALIKLWNGESGWNSRALNASSGAYGIPQALPASKMGSAGPDWRTNPATQIKWGMGYIKGRYGSPAAALSTWTRRSPHWYDDGGPLPPGLTLAANGTGAPEAILTDSQWSTAAAAIARTTAAAAPAAAGNSPRADLESLLRGLTVRVQVGNEEISHIARTEVYAATGALVAVLDAGGGN